MYLRPSRSNHITKGVWACVFLCLLDKIRIGLVHLEALASCANAKPLIISNPTVSKAEVSCCRCYCLLLL